MKKLITLVLVVVTVFAVSSCSFKKVPTGTTNSAADTDSNVYYVYVGETDPTVYEVDLDPVTVTEGAMSVLAYLKENEGLDYVYTVGSWGGYLTKVGPFVAEGNTYIALYTTVEEDMEVPGPYRTEKVVNGVTFVYAGVGVSSMHVTAGARILITLASY